MTAPRNRSPRAWQLGIVAFATLTLGGYAVYRALLHESATTPASIAAAIERFRAQPPVARTLPAALRGRVPQPGVYVYATSGSEVSHVLGTRRHAYPLRTTITVTSTPRGCLRTRWDVLSTRHDALLACPRSSGGGWRLVTQSEEHAFAGHVDRRAYLCTRASTFRPAQLTVGARWQSRCAIPGTSTAEDSAVLGLRTLALHGERTQTLLLRTDTRVSGDTDGSGVTLTWVLPRTGLVVRRTIANASSTDTLVGAVRYREVARLALTSRRPRR